MTDQTEHQADKPNKKPGQFAKGDARINRKGRPKNFDQLRRLAQELAHEALDKDGQPVVINGHQVTRAEMILRQMAVDPKRQAVFLEVAFGKVPTEIKFKLDGVNLRGILETLPPDVLDKIADDPTHIGKYLNHGGGNSSEKAQGQD